MMFSIGLGFIGLVTLTPLLGGCFPDEEGYSYQPEQPSVVYPLPYAPELQAPLPSDYINEDMELFRARQICALNPYCSHVEVYPD